MITFNNVPDSIRTPGTYAEIDNSRALTGLVQNPHKVLIIGEKIAAGSAEKATLYSISRDSLADGYFGSGSLLARMCNKFKTANPNTELWAIALSAGTTQASARINFSRALSHAGGSCSQGDQQLRLLINGKKCYINLTSGWSGIDIASAATVYISETGGFPCTASATATSAGTLILSALTSGTWGNYLDVRLNYYDGESNPTFFKDSITVSNFEGGAGAGLLTDVWAVIDDVKFNHIVQPYIDDTNLSALELELDNRFKPLEDKAGHAYTGLRGAYASCVTLGISRNNPHNTIIGAYDSPTEPNEWAAVLAAISAENLNNDPARPLQYLQLPEVLPPPFANRFTRTERDILLKDGIATWICDSGGNVMIERCITTYRTNSAGAADPSYLDIETLFTLDEIRYQFKTRMISRFISPRFKLADDSFNVQPGTYVATPKTIKQEIVALFSLLQDRGLIENLDDFVKNLRVERNSADVNRVDVLLPPNLINQFRCLCGLVQFLL